MNRCCRRRWPARDDAMPVFEYRALQTDGTMAAGELEAGGRQEAFRQMEGLGLRPIRLAERGGNGSPKAAAKRPAKEPAGAQEAKSPLSFGGSKRISGRMLEN